MLVMRFELDAMAELLDRSCCGSGVWSDFLLHSVASIGSKRGIVVSFISSSFLQ